MSAAIARPLAAGLTPAMYIVAIDSCQRIGDALKATLYWWTTGSAVVQIIQAADGAWGTVLGDQYGWRRYSTPQQALDALISALPLVGNSPAGDLPRELTQWHSNRSDA